MSYDAKVIHKDGEEYIHPLNGNVGVKEGVLILVGEDPGEIFLYAPSEWLAARRVKR